MKLKEYFTGFIETQNILTKVKQFNQKFILLENL